MDNPISFWYQQGITTLPLQPSSKYLYTGFNVRQWTQRATLADLEFWFNYFPGCNYAISPDRGLTVLDFDNHIDYWLWHRDWRVDTYTVSTRRGYHVYLWIDEPTENLTCKQAEIKRQYQPVVIPPSKVYGHEYKALWDYPIQRLKSLGEAIVTQSKEERYFPTTFLPFTLRDDNPNLIQRVRQQVSLLAYLKGYDPKPSNGGRFFMAYCPAHRDERRSLSIDTYRGVCSCFRGNCELHSRRGFDVIGLHARLNGLSNGAAARELAG